MKTPTFISTERLCLGIAAVLFLFWGLFACNTAPEAVPYMNLHLPDSLSKDVGNYDSLQVHLVDEKGGMIQPLIFHRPFLFEETDGVIREILLNKPLSPNFQVQIIAYKGGVPALEAALVVTEGVSAPIIAVEFFDDSLPPVTDGPTSLTLSESTLALGVGAAPRRLNAFIVPSDFVGIVLFTSSVSTIASVDADGFISALTEGEITITATLQGFPEIQATALVTVTKGTSDVGPTRPDSPRFDDAITTRSPTKLPRPVWAWISSGIDGRGTGAFRWSLNTSPPLEGEGMETRFSPAADLPDGTYTLTLEERDSLGNWSEPVTRTLRIQTQGALVSIDTPQRPAYSNDADGVIPVAWSVNGTPQSTGQTHTLTQENAWNLIRREYTDSAGNLTFDTLSVFWDKTPPVVSISAPKDGDWVNKSTVTVTWSVDGNPQTRETTELLGTADGPKTIVRSFTDSAGNVGTASVTVLLDVTAPGSPVGITTTSPTSNATPTFEWSSGGGGNGTFQVKFGNNNFAVDAIEVDEPSHQAAALADGRHVLYVRERDDAGNWSVADTGSVWVDKSNPILTNPGNKTLTATSTTLSFTASDGAGTGVKSATCRWGTTTVDANFSGGTWNCAISGLSAVQTQVTLEVVDGVGLKGSANLTLTVNLPVPAVVVTPKYKRYATALSYVTVDYTLDGAAKKADFTNLSTGENILEITGTANALGQVSRDTARVYSLPNVIFVDKNATGTGTGNNWDDAYDDLAEALNSTKGRTSGTDIWITTGVYGSSTDGPAFSVSNGVELFGGFPNDGTGYQLASRTLENPTVLSQSVSFGFMVTLSSNTTLDNFKFLFVDNYTGPLEADGKNIKIKNASMNDWQVGDGRFLEISDNSEVGFENSSISDISSAWTPAVIIGESCVVDFVSTKINDFRGGGFPGYVFPIVSVGVNSKIRFLSYSEMLRPSNSGEPLPAFTLETGAELAISSNSTVGAEITGTGKSCSGNTLPCP